VLRPRSLASLGGRNLTDALRSYVTRAQRGYEDSVLVAGTDKDLIRSHRRSRPHRVVRIMLDRQLPDATRPSLSCARARCTAPSTRDGRP
jgi:hypothetical protein